MIGQTVGHYRITDKIGSGGMGDVYRATDTTLHREVAIKVISPEFATDPERMARFEREAQVLASLTHGSIAAVYGLERAAGHRALVMELVDGEDLSARLRRAPLPLADALRIAAHIAEALEAAHEHGVIHRDLKPANIKLLESGHVKLLDFGLAKALDDAAPVHLTGGEAATLSVAATRAGIILGTAAYMSPEQATGAAADKRSDVWSFGVVLFELLTGTRLFDGQTTSHVLADVIRAEVDFGRLPAGVPAEVRTLIERCLERDPRRRLRDIREARLVLERSVERHSGSHSAIRSGPMTAPVVTPAPRWRERLPWIAVGALAAGSLVAAAAWAFRPSPQTAPQLHIEAPLPGGKLVANVGPPFELSPDGQSLAMIVEGRSQGAASLVLRRLGQLQSTTLITEAVGPAQPYNPFFSPDGAWIGYALPGELRRVPATGGTPLTITKVTRSRGASWASDGTIVFAPSPEAGLLRINVAGGEPQPLTTLDKSRNEATHRWPHVLPGGKAVLFTSHTNAIEGFDKASIEVVKLDTGERKVVHTGGSSPRYVPSGHLVYATNNTLFAIRFDLDRLETIGQPTPVVHDVTSSSSEGSTHYTFGSNGLLAYMRGTPAAPEHPILWVDRSGRTTTLHAEPGTYTNPRLSPDGKRLALTVLKGINWDIWVYDLERQVFTRATFDEAAETEQVWSPDSRELAYSLDLGGTRSVLSRRPADGSGAVTVIARPEGLLWPQAWSPDGRFLAVTSGLEDIGALPLTGDNPKTTWIVNSTFGETDPAISPDGRFVAYTSRESGQPEVYVRQFPSGSGRWQVSTNGGGYPRWARGGRELVYRTMTGIMSVPMDTAGETLRAGTPSELFRGDFAGGLEGIAVNQYIFGDYDVSADGSRFVMFPKPADGSGAGMRLITVVTNWFDELGRVAGRR